MRKPSTWLMLLVALLLPFKGAMAAAGMFCHLGSNLSMKAIVQPHGHHGDGSHAHSHSDRGADDAESNVPDHSPESPASPSCAICSAVCSAPPLPATGLSAIALPPAGAERFPALVYPRVSAVSDGLERPPRTI